MMGLVRTMGLLGVVAIAPAVLRAPAPVPAAPGQPATLRDVVAAARDTRLAGWDLVDHVTGLVHQRYTHYSAWHLWETPERSFRHGRGMSNQFNGALAIVLRELGFQVEQVHAARVRLNRGPWWHSGHTWLRVTIAGRTRDVCAARAEHRAGAVSFTAVTPVRPFTRLTYLDTTVALAPFTLEAIWRSTLNDEPPPRWLLRPFGEPVEVDPVMPGRTTQL